MATRSAKKLPAVPVVLIIVALLATLWLVATDALPKFGSSAAAGNTQVIQSITREKDVVLLSLGIQEIAEKSESGDILGVSIPWTEGTSYVEYSFAAKLGIEGEEVEISQTGDNSYTISIPEFTFIGVDNQSVRLIAENNGALSWLSPKIDQVELVNSILDFDKKNEYVDGHREILEDQAKSFYTEILAGIDPAIDVDFEFRR